MQHAYLNPTHYTGPLDHSYELECERTFESGTVSHVLLSVNARNRNQARTIAERAGYTVRSVNMVS